MYWEWEVDYSKIKFTPEKRKGGQGKRGDRVVYAEQLCAFDIEVTRFEEVEQSAMFVWQFSVNNDIVIMGRTWEQFSHMQYMFKEMLGNMTLLCFVHNLSFEGQYLSGIYDFNNSEVFATDSRKLLKMSMYGCFEFRCSYRLFNMSLDAVTKKYNCAHSKKSGDDFDYTKRRTSKTELTEQEIEYCVNDVMGLVEAIKAQNEIYGDNLYSMPFTQTGYVRREAKRKMRPYHHELVNCWPSWELFQVMRCAFRGGNTHGNRYYVGDIIENVHGNDVSSEYPAQQVLEEYPRTPFELAGALSTNISYIDKLINRGAALLIVADFFNLELRDRYNGFPYISAAKAIGHIKESREDNGRVLSCEFIRLAITDIDYKIIEKQYKAKRVDIVQIWSSWYGPMYEGIIELNKELFLSKTELKGVSGQELYYAKSKEQLNAIYGMSCQNPLNIGINFEHLKYIPVEDDPAEILEKAGKQPFMVYQLGIWTTAHARAELQKFIDRAGDNAIYCDTDSLMYVGNVDFSDFNEDYRKRCENIGRGAWAEDKTGRRRYMGVFESEDAPGENCKYRRFITQGAKRYAFEKAGTGELGITVAGVGKRAGAEELKRKGGLESFKPGLLFENSGKLEAVYNDYPAGEFIIDGELIEFTENVTLRPTHYLLSHTNDYSDIISKCTLKDLQAAIRDWRRQSIDIEKITPQKKNSY